MLQMKNKIPFCSTESTVDIDTTSLFLTSEFESSVTSLANINSLSLLLNMLGRTLGTTKAMDSNPYIHILFNSVKPIRYVPGDTNFAAVNDFVNLWHAEVLYKTLLQVVPKNIADPILLRNLVSHFTYKLRNAQKHNNSHSVYSDKFICYMRTTLSRMFAYDDVKFRSQFNVHTVISNSFHTLECMSALFAREGKEKLCMLLSFFGATYDAEPSARGTSSEILSSTVLKNTLEYDRELDHMCAGITSQNADEIYHRKAISDALFSEITRIYSKIENVESLLHKQCKWYHFIRQIHKFFLSTFTIHKLYHGFKTMKKLDRIFRNSTAFGDCAAFFLALRKVEKTSRNTHTSSLFNILNKVQRTYKPITHSEYVSSVKDCFMSSIPTQIFPLSAGRTLGLHNIKKVGINFAFKRPSARLNDLLNRVLSPGNSEKLSPDAMISHSSPLLNTKRFLRLLGHQSTLQHNDKKTRGKHSLLSEIPKTFLQYLHPKKAANDSPDAELPTSDVHPVSDVAHKKAPLLSSVSKALKIKYKKAACTVAAITHSPAANDSPDEELPTSDMRPISDVAHKKAPLLSSVSKALKIKYKKAAYTAAATTHSPAANDSPDEELPTSDMRPDSPDAELPTSDMRPVSDVAHKKAPLLSSVSKALKIKYKNYTAAAITHSPAANDSPDAELPTSDMRPITRAAHRKVPLSSR